jgi:hypothetical protein
VSGEQDKSWYLRQRRVDCSQQVLYVVKAVIFRDLAPHIDEVLRPVLFPLTGISVHPDDESARGYEDANGSSDILHYCEIVCLFVGPTTIRPVQGSSSTFLKAS